MGWREERDVKRVTGKKCRENVQMLNLTPEIP
jgi:hypothetical protein